MPGWYSTVPSEPGRNRSYKDNSTNRGAKVTAVEAAIKRRQLESGR